MLQLTQTNNSRLKRIDNLKEIISHAKDSKDNLIYTNGINLYSTNETGCIYKRLFISEYTPWQIDDMDNFIFFSMPQFKFPSAKLLLETINNGIYWLVDNKIIVSNDYVFKILESNYYFDSNINEIVYTIDGNIDILPCIMCNEFDLLYIYYFHLFKEPFYNFLNFSNIIDTKVIPTVIFNNIESTDVFLEMTDKKKEYGNFLLKLNDGEMDYILSLYKNMVPYKKGDKISVTITKSDLSSLTYTAMYTIDRKKHTPIQVFVTYINLLYKNNSSRF